MENLSYKIIVQRQELQKKIYAVLCVLLICGMGAYTYFKWQKLVTLREGVLNDKTIIATLTKQLPEEKNAYNAAKPSFDNLSTKIDNSIKEILPQGEQYTELTRRLDMLEEKFNSKANPFEVSNIDFQTPVVKDTYGILPFRMSIRASADNFGEFLKLMQTSGSFSNQMRLMNISSIRLNFENADQGTGGPEMITFNVQINAYFQK